MSLSRPLKVLCLHGFLQNSKIFYEKASGIRKALKKINAETFFLDGPTILEKKDLPFEIDDENKWKEIVDSGINRAWWYHVEDLNIENALTAVKECILKEGPFDGILGFSQGAALAAIVTNNISTLVPGHQQFKFSILFSAYAFTTTDESAVLKEKYAHLFKVPNDLETLTIHVYGSSDTHVPKERSLLLASYYPENIKKTIEHEGGHFVPNKKPIISKIIEYVETSLKN
ncbi:hypothetical protein PACTADRAFT_49059 [Pachysolen tannophilus NRRL Y-2460]|uniref:Serine hydrolase domain-containing protein n=1 Tax=Pachysolen tannophilus NRRL Y-2460 TaxID=669874 RepID=A0A1E4U014_PACTA|nr:hypothetical protein PACTADRAFT_49059 [Pachysolen tannophilus NRRL Y-2460]